MNSNEKSHFASNSNNMMNSQSNRNHFTELSSFRRDPTSNELTESHQNMITSPAQKGMHSNNTVTRTEQFTSCGDNFVEMCQEMNKEIQKKNKEMLEKYIVEKSREIGSEMASLVKTWDKTRLGELEKKNQATQGSQTGRNPQVSISEKKILEPPNKNFLTLIKKFYEQLVLYEEIVKSTKEMSDGLKIRLIKIYKTMTPECKWIFEKKNYKLKETKVLDQFLQGKTYCLLEALTNQFT